MTPRRFVLVKTPRHVFVAGSFAVVIAIIATTAIASGDRDVVRPTEDFTAAEPYEQLPTGAATSRKPINANAFSHSSANMSFERELAFKVGNGFFRRIWVSAPSSTKAADGLGPLFNAKSCQRCHLKDGRGHPPNGNWPVDNAVSMVLRLSIPPQTEEHRALLDSGRANVIPEPTYGGQLQDFAIQGHKAEGRMQISYREIPIQLSDGETASLRQPTYTVTNLSYGSLRLDAMFSPRIANPMIGLGFLEAITEVDIRAQADPQDRNSDGISGRVNEVWSPAQRRMILGRFGWKAGNGTVEDQSAAAFSHDIGISNPDHPLGSGECTILQTTCRQATHGGDKQYSNLEVPKKVMDLVTFYASNLAVPQRRNVNDPRVLAGKKAFYNAGCIACHRPKYITPHDIPGKPEQSRQLIWPYTDMLLHDMGPGLADNRPEGRADGREWRTPPLWGIGLTEDVNGHTNFLHDGRARNLLEAIIWHGGEAEAAKTKVVNMPLEDRYNLIRFLESL